MPHTLRSLRLADEPLAELTMLCGFDDDLAAVQITQTSNRIRGLLTQIHPALERVLGPRLDHPAVLDLLERYPSPAELAATSEKTLANRLTKLAPRMGKSLAAEIVQALSEQAVAVPGTQAATIVMPRLAQQLASLRKQRDEVASEVERLVHVHPHIAPPTTWQHVRTTNPIESTIATARHRTTRTRNCLSRATFLGMALKLIEAADEASANLGDARLPCRLVALARQLSVSPHTSLPQALSPAELKAAYRFFDNDQVDTEGVLAPHIAQTLHRMEQIPVVLAIQDTTEFNLTHLPATDGLGRCTGGNERGFLMHSLLAVSPEGLPLGVLGMKTWARREGTQGSAALRKSRPIHEKESIKWVEGLAHLLALKSRCEHAQLIGIGDRESDVYELFAAQRPDGRGLADAHGMEPLCPPSPALSLAGGTGHPPAACHTELLVPTKGSRPQRTACLTLRYACVRLRPPQTRTRLPELDIFAVHVIEDEPPAAIEPLEWMLLTSVPTHTPAQALELLQWYAPRWTIETWHRVLKSGCRIEAHQFGTLERFVRATSLFAIIAWRILYTTLLARLDGDLPCEVVLFSLSNGKPCIAACIEPPGRRTQRRRCTRRYDGLPTWATT